MKTTRAIQKMILYSRIMSRLSCDSGEMLEYGSAAAASFGRRAMPAITITTINAAHRLRVDVRVGPLLDLSEPRRFRPVMLPPRHTDSISPQSHKMTRPSDPQTARIVCPQCVGMANCRVRSSISVSGCFRLCMLSADDPAPQRALYAGVTILTVSPDT